MCWGGRLFLKGDRRLDLFCFTKLLTVWQKCPSKASLSRHIRVLEENTLNLDRLAIQLASMDSRFFLKLLVLAFAEAPSLAVFRSNFIKN